MTDPASQPTDARPDAYDAIADVYDRFWADVLAPAMLGVLDRVLDHALASVAPSAGPSSRKPRLLDLCCGTGQLAAGMISRGWAVVGVDGSPAMLERARRRAPEATLRLADMRALEVGDVAAEGRFDAVLCAFDSLNHLPDADALAAVFAQVYAALRPDGRFVFDVNVREGFEARFDGSLGFADPDLVCVVQASFDGLFGRYDFIVLRPATAGTPGGAWRRDDATLVQRCFEIPEILAALDRAGFPDPVVLDAEADLDLEGHIGRAVFIVDRPA